MNKTFLLCLPLIHSVTHSLALIFTRARFLAKTPFGAIVFCGTVGIFSRNICPFSGGGGLGVLVQQLLLENLGLVWRFASTCGTVFKCVGACGYVCRDRLLT
ncbi:hypothetical protein XELAEV_18020167mg [Xenopus laevis]|uniref:Uncharacterized protein n=1 Tax=Xenopus laevis TaxID=8355 RepID=A0A974D6E0_XENLA|nr:hypothetical protein XELAEV_18020167mg [Xenopus laevis]